MGARVSILLVVLVSLASIFSAGYIAIMFDGKVSATSVVEGLNFSVQTITTVGYGNWVPAGVDADDPRVFLVKVLSLPFMLIAGTLFAVVVGMVANLLSR